MEGQMADELSGQLAHIQSQSTTFTTTIQRFVGNAVVLQTRSGAASSNASLGASCTNRPLHSHHRNLYTLASRPQESVTELFKHIQHNAA